MMWDREKPDAMGVSPASSREPVEVTKTAELDNGEISPDALGGTIDDLPPGYYRSFKFIGTMVAVLMGYMSSSLAFLCATNVLTVINADIGADGNYVWFAIVVSS